MEGLVISIIISIGILYLWDKYNFKRANNLYRKFDKNRHKLVQSSKYLDEIMDDYSNRLGEESREIDVLRRELIESGNKSDYWILSIIGTFIFFSLYFGIFFDMANLITSDIIIIGFVIPPIILILLILIITRKHVNNWLIVGLTISGSYILRSVIIFMVVAYIFYEDVPDFYSTISVQGWHMEIAAISFSFGVALFIVLSLTSLLERGRTLLKELKLELSDMIKITGVSKLSDLYKEKNFENLYLKYEDSKMASRNIHTLTISILFFITFGLIFIGLATQEPIPAPSYDSFEILTSDQFLMFLLGTLMLITFFSFYTLMTKEVFRPKDEK